MIKNIEDISEYNIPDNFNVKNEFGFSAMMRIKNEEEYIVPCMIAAKDIFDEFIIAYNNSTDGTRFLINQLKGWFPKPILECEYPFDLEFRGPAHQQIPVNSLKHSAYFYNWVMSKCNYCYVMKQDGDNILLPNFKNTLKRVRSNQYHAIENFAWDLTGQDLRMLGEQQTVSHEKRIFNCNHNAMYTSSPNGMTQHLSLLPKESPCIYREVEPSFLHLKWTKRKPTYYWPDNWEKILHFRAIAQRHAPKSKYHGIYPRVLIDYLKFNKDPLKLIELYANNNIDPLEETNGL